MWLTARWGLHTRVAGRTVWVPNRHGPWPLHAARLLDLDTTLLAACRVEVRQEDRLRPLWSPGVHTTFAWPSRVSTDGVSGAR